MLLLAGCRLQALKGSSAPAPGRRGRIRRRQHEEGEDHVNNIGSTDPKISIWLEVFIT